MEVTTWLAMRYGTRLVAWVSGAVVTVVLLVGTGLLAVVVAMSGKAAEDQEGACAGEHTVTPVSDSARVSTGSYDAEQRRNAATIIAVGKRMGLPAYGWVIAVATGLQESGLRNLGYGDRDSVGLFQQRPSQGWGSPSQLQSPAYASHQFYAHLQRLSSWQQMPLTVAAQSVQRSAFPGAYAAQEADARRLVQQMAGGRQLSPASLAAAPKSCGAGAAVASGPIRFPLAAGSFRDLNNYGGAGSLWATTHTGDDLAAPCGTPVSAITSGTIRIRTDQPWAGPHLVEVETGTGRLTTWYGHMERVDVRQGQRVHSGQPIGLVGDLGNATGCHLHVEVHPHGGGYGQDDVDPHTWLAVHAGGGAVRAQLHTAAHDDARPVGQERPRGEGGHDG